MYYSLIHLYIHPFIHPSVYSFFFFFSFGRGGGRDVWGHSKSCLYRKRIRRPGREGRGIYLFLTSFPFLYCICISNDSFSFFLFFYLLTFIYKLCLRKQSDYPIISSLKRLAFLAHRLSLHLNIF